MQVFIKKIPAKSVSQDATGGMCQQNEIKSSEDKTGDPKIKKANIGEKHR